ncbi:MAG: type II toxin-antitoxin system YafQ family toxin [Spirochaetota bacterium]|nr:type II toxin-antitoxin system YafQ family toxin [Spirochaetota bacterium]
MYIIKSTNRFQKDYKRLVKAGDKNTDLLKTVMGLLANNKKLEPKYRDHVLIGKYKDRRECHIKPDWLLIYKIEYNVIIFERTGSHSELFK